jgi:hypothetical protein
MLRAEPLVVRVSLFIQKAANKNPTQEVQKPKKPSKNQRNQRNQRQGFEKPKKS